MNETHSNCPEPKGTLVIIGGAEDRKANNKEDKSRLETLRCFTDLLPEGASLIEVITTASSAEPQQTFQEYKEAFSAMGNYQIHHIHHDERKDVLTGEWEQRIKNADGIFFTGGDQLKLTSIYGGTEFNYLLKERYIDEPLVIAGTSAGVMALSTPMIYYGTGQEEYMAGHVKVTTGLEYLRDVCIDTHFVARGRFVRMAQVLATNPSCTGVGIEEDTCIIVRNGREAQVGGSGVVVVVDALQSVDSNITEFSEDKAISIRNLRVSILSKGDVFNIPQTNLPHQ